MKKEFIIFLCIILLLGCSSQDNTLWKEDGQSNVLKSDADKVVAENNTAVQKAPPLAEKESVEQETPKLLLIGGKTAEQRIKEAYDTLHDEGSSEIILSNFPDVELVYTDTGKGSFFPQDIFPFHYYYSKEANRTFNLCSVGRSVFICKGKMDRAITKIDIDNGRCEVTPVYMSDIRLKENN